MTFRPAANFNGPASFTYTLSDGSLTGTGSVTVDVASVNDPPVAVDDDKTAVRDTPLSFPASASSPTTVARVDGRRCRRKHVPGPTRGALGPITGSSVTYTPAANYNGPDIFRFGRFALRPRGELTLETGTGAGGAARRFWGRRRGVWDDRGDVATLRTPSRTPADMCRYRGGRPGSARC